MKRRKSRQRKTCVRSRMLTWPNHADNSPPQSPVLSRCTQTETHTYNRGGNVHTGSLVWALTSKSKKKKRLWKRYQRIGVAGDVKLGQNLMLGHKILFKNPMWIGKLEYIALWWTKSQVVTRLQFSQCCTLRNCHLCTPQLPLYAQTLPQ